MSGGLGSSCKLPTLPSEKNENQLQKLDGTECTWSPWSPKVQGMRPIGWLRLWSQTFHDCLSPWLVIKCKGKLSWHWGIFQYRNFVIEKQLFNSNVFQSKNSGIASRPIPGLRNLKCSLDCNTQLLVFNSSVLVCGLSSKFTVDLAHPTALWEDPSSSLTADGCVNRYGHFDMQPCARAAHLL